MSDPGSIRLRGVRQNNLKGFDLDVPLGRYVVVTGLSGAGKSSLVFETLHAEGQRRYVETFSPYTRQFLELLDKPKVDSIENIRPSIAIQQTNTVKTSRSTVGTMTEIADYAKVWFAHAAACFDPETGERVEDDSPESVWQKALSGLAARATIVAFKVARPANIDWREIAANLRGQGYTRLLVQETSGDSAGLVRLDDFDARNAKALAKLAHIFVVQDRIEIAAEARTRFLEAVEAAFHFGQAELRLFTESGAGWSEAGHYSRGLHSPKSGRRFRPATPGLFSFNSPIGACPRCRGFGRIIDIDYRLAIPDRSLSIMQGAVKPWEGQIYGESKLDLLKFTKRLGIPVNVPFRDLSEEHQSFIVDGQPGYGKDGLDWPKAWYGLKGFFRYLETKTYKMHVRVFLSRFRAYNPCPDCGGSRLQPEALCWKWKGRTLPELYQMPVSDLLAQLDDDAPAHARDHQATLALDGMSSRLRYLDEVGLGYLTLDRASRTLSGGEVQRVNLTTCLGSSLVDTLFVLDEPSVGLHPRDIERLIGIIRSLTNAGNTVVVVEHDEAMIRAADHVIEIGPEPGVGGGHVVFSGTVPALTASSGSITGDYLAGRRWIAVPESRRACGRDTRWLEFTRASKHNIRALSFRLPLNRFVCLSGVSGSGKSTMLEHVIHQGLLAHRSQFAEDAATIDSISGSDGAGELVLVDQSPLSRSPRSNPALFSDTWDIVRDLYASTDTAREAGMTASSFSFNSGDGRCVHCQGRGHEAVEMQFLADVYVPCPVCEGKRFRPEVLAVQWNGKSVAELLRMTIAEAHLFLGPSPAATRLAPLIEVGLGYLTMGQPLNTLSGGEAQRLKLVRYLGDFARDQSAIPNPQSAIPTGALLLLDEPTTGMHRHDVLRLLDVLQKLVDAGHSLVVIEHNTDILKCADWILEVGPEAGVGGGRIVAEGTPEQVARADVPSSPFLAAALDGTPMRQAIAAESAFANAAPRESAITVVGARENNLQGLTVTIPHHELTVVTGVSGSGKSTLAFDIIFAEGQRRFMESMSAYARQFVEQLARPAIDAISGIPPTVAIEQRVTRGSRKSTVATITEVAQFLRLIYARIGIQHHPDSDRPITALTAPQLRKHFESLLRTRAAQRSKSLWLCAPIVRGRKGHHEPVAKWIAAHGFERMRVDGKLIRTDAFKKLDRYSVHDIEVVIADLKSASTTLPAEASAKAGRRHSKLELLDRALSLGKGACFILDASGKIFSWLSTSRTDAATGETFPDLEPKHFSFNSPTGWCPTCRGHGRLHSWMLKEDDEDTPEELVELARLLTEDPDSEVDGSECPDCHGARLNRVARSVKLHFRKREPLSLPELTSLPPSQMVSTLRALKLDSRGKAIVRDVLPEIESRLRFLDSVGLGYLALDRPTLTLSGGEAQRIRLAAQLGSNLSGVLYVLDEPSIGLHSQDNERLVRTLRDLKSKGNTVLVVEHDDVIMDAADRIIDLGPGAGRNGGHLLANDTPANLRRNAKSLTGIYLDKGISHPIRGEYRAVLGRSPLAGDSKRASQRSKQSPASGLLPSEANTNPDWLTLTRVTYRNLRDQTLSLPLGRLVMVCGPSGAGKSTLFRDILHPAAATAIKAGKAKLTGKEFAKRGKSTHGDSAIHALRSLGEGGRNRESALPFEMLRRANAFKAVIEVDQSPIGKTPRSTPATYLGVFDIVRGFFATLPEARIRGYQPGRFSFNTAGGRCETCAGAGRIKLEMSFMPNAYLPCDDCGGLRYGPELRDISWKGRNIGEVLQLTFDEALEFFDFHAHLREVCRLMVDTGLGYLTLGQSSPTLSGGEAQRLKLVTELARGLQTYTERSRGLRPRNLYILEEPTIGLHLSDCEKLIHVLHRLVDQGHSVVVIEHHLDLLAEADYIVELGPGGGPAGGEIVYQGALAGLLKNRRSPTAPYLRTKFVRA
ncbi:MAG TPA: excinuclease ABC subunit UvrA [Opitutaceae bacterium]|nr:excinuclease ABC subunit UvrA [Opitutaceae bacterium]